MSPYMRSAALRAGGALARQFVEPQRTIVADPGNGVPPPFRFAVSAGAEPGGRRVAAAPGPARHLAR